MNAVEIPVDNVIVLDRLRKIDELKVIELSRSIEQINLLHPIHVVEKDNVYVLISGNHRLNSFKLLKRPNIPAVVHEEDNALVHQLIELEENLSKNSLTVLEEGDHIVLREKILIELGQKSVAGSNNYTKKAMSNATLSEQLKMNKRTYQYKKQVSKINAATKKLIADTKTADNLNDLITLSRQPENVQIEVGKILHNKQARTFKRALLMAKTKFINSTWTKENEELRDEIQRPQSVMRFERKQDRLSDLCKLVSHDEDLRVQKVTADFGLSEMYNYSMSPEMARWFVKYWSKENDLVVDCSAGYFTNLIAAAYENRRVIGYDLTKEKIDAARNVFTNYMGLDESRFTLHHSDGMTMKEYADQSNIVDCFLIDPPYVEQVEIYSDDSRDLCNCKTQEEFYDRIEVMLSNCYRLIKPSNYKTKEFKPVIIKCSSVRKGERGLITMDTPIEERASKLGFVLHDKVLSEHRPTLNYLQKCINSRYTLKVHEINLVFLKYQ